MRSCSWREPRLMTRDLGLRTGSLVSAEEPDTRLEAVEPNRCVLNVQLTVGQQPAVAAGPLMMSDRRGLGPRACHAHV